MQFNLVICGLDSVEARRWINATILNLVDYDNPDSIKPLIDGGTEGRYAQRLSYQIDLLIANRHRFQRPSARYHSDTIFML
jgi:molybdopterin/thiamine biosynthesis adenylyltransferase